MSQRVHKFRMRVLGVPGEFTIVEGGEWQSLSWFCDCGTNGVDSGRFSTFVNRQEGENYSLWIITNFLETAHNFPNCACARWMKIEKVFLEAMR